MKKKFLKDFFLSIIEAMGSKNKNLKFLNYWFWQHKRQPLTNGKSLKKTVFMDNTGIPRSDGFFLMDGINHGLTGFVKSLSVSIFLMFGIKSSRFFEIIFFLFFGNVAFIFFFYVFSLSATSLMFVFIFSSNFFPSVIRGVGFYYSGYWMFNYGKSAFNSKINDFFYIPLKKPLPSDMEIKRLKFNELYENFMTAHEKLWLDQLDPIVRKKLIRVIMEPAKKIPEKLRGYGFEHMELPSLKHQFIRSSSKERYDLIENLLTEIKREEFIRRYPIQPKLTGIERDYRGELFEELETMLGEDEKRKILDEQRLKKNPYEDYLEHYPPEKKEKILRSLVNSGTSTDKKRPYSYFDDFSEHLETFLSTFPLRLEKFIWTWSIDFLLWLKLIVRSLVDGCFYYFTSELLYMLTVCQFVFTLGLLLPIYVGLVAVRDRSIVGYLKVFSFFLIFPVLLKISRIYLFFSLVNCILYGLVYIRRHFPMFLEIPVLFAQNLFAFSSWLIFLKILPNLLVILTSLLKWFDVVYYVVFYELVFNLVFLMQALMRVFFYAMDFIFEFFFFFFVYDWLLIRIYFLKKVSKSIGKTSYFVKMVIIFFYKIFILILPHLLTLNCIPWLLPVWDIVYPFCMFINSLVSVNFFRQSDAIVELHSYEVINSFSKFRENVLFVQMNRSIYTFYIVVILPLFFFFKIKIDKKFRSRNGNFVVFIFLCIFFYCNPYLLDFDSMFGGPDLFQGTNVPQNMDGKEPLEMLEKIENSRTVLDGRFEQNTIEKDKHFLERLDQVIEEMEKTKKKK